MSKTLSMASSGYQMSDKSVCGEVSTSGLPLRKIARRKIHCILPSSPWLADSKTNIPLGVLYIAGLLREQGHDVVVTSMLDKRYEGNIHLPESVMDADVHMFGFCTPQFGEALELAAYIKDRNPEALLVAGGPHPSYEPKETKEAGRQDTYHYKGTLAARRDYRAADGRALFDTVIVMEGEVATLQMLSDWDAGQLQPYYYGDKADAMDLDAIPFPAWDLLPQDHIYNDGVAVMKQKYFPNAAHPESSSAVMSLIGTRGCPYKCTYCFAKGSLINMADGTKKPIEALEIGDFVLSFDRSTGFIEPQPLTRIGCRRAEDLYEMRLADGTLLKVTGDHPFVTSEGWKNAKDCEGSFLRRLRSATSESKSVRVDSQNVFGHMQTRSSCEGAAGSSKDARGESQFSRVGTSVSRSADDCTEDCTCRTTVGDATTRREMARSAYGTDGAWESNGQPRNIGEDETNNSPTVRRWSSSYWSKATGEALRVSAARIYQAAAGTKTRYTGTTSEFRTNEVRQPNASSRSGGENGCVTQAGIQGRSNQSAFASRFQRARVGVIQALSRSWTTYCALRWSAILDWAMSIRFAAQSGYATPLGEASGSFFSPVLAYAGAYRDPTPRLSECRMECVTPLGRLPEDARIDELGPCPGGRISGDWILVESVSFVGRSTVYPISVATHETFFAGGVAVHNCSTPWIGQKPRYRSPHNIITEMSQVMDKGVRMFKFQDDTYTLHKTKLRELADAVDSAFGRDAFAARIHTRVNTMDDHVAESLKRMSCRVTCFGIESGSQKVLDANQKGTKVAQNTQALITAKQHGFYTIAFLVIGMAGETLETMRETQKWLLSVKPYLDSCNLAVGIPYPGSRWWTHPQESGIDIVDYNYDNQWIVGFSARDEILVRPHGATVEEMFQIKREMFDFLVHHGWAKAEWDEDSRIRKQQDDAVKSGSLTAASGLTYAGH